MKSDYIPYIYSDEELLQIMHYADNLMPKRPNECSDFLHLKVPMAIRILYGYPSGISSPKTRRILADFSGL